MISIKQRDNIFNDALQEVRLLTNSIDTVKEAVKSTDSKAELEAYNKAKAAKIVFCNIAWMKHYHGITENDKPKNGGSFVTETGDAWESLNFFPRNHV